MYVSKPSTIIHTSPNSQKSFVRLHTLKNIYTSPHSQKTFVRLHTLKKHSSESSVSCTRTKNTCHESQSIYRFPYNVDPKFKTMLRVQFCLIFLEYKMSFRGQLKLLALYEGNICHFIFLRKTNTCASTPTHTHTHTCKTSISLSKR